MKHRDRVNAMRDEADRLDAELKGEKTQLVKFEYKPETRVQQLFMTLEDPTYSVAAKTFSSFIMVLILTGCATQIMESMEEFQFLPRKCNKSRPTVSSCRRKPFREFYIIEAACMLVFTIEYSLRLFLVATVPMAAWLPQIKKGGWKRSEKEVSGNSDQQAPARLSRRSLVRDAIYMSTKNAKTSRHGRVVDVTTVPATARERFQARRKYAIQTMNLIDLVAILPFWLEVSGLTRSKFGVVRIIRLTRVLRMLKSPSISNSVNVFYSSFAASLPALSILFFFSILAIILVGTLGYIFEQGEFTVDEPDLCCPPDSNSCIGCYLRQKSDGVGREPSPFTSIPRGMYWVVITITTVGYGDLYPTSSAGRLLAVLITYSGVLAIALPISVIGNNFTLHYERARLEQKRRELKMLETKQKVASTLTNVFNNVRNRSQSLLRRGASQQKFNPFNFISSSLRGAEDDDAEDHRFARRGRRKRKFSSREREELKRQAATRIIEAFRRRKAQRAKKHERVHPVTELSPLEEMASMSPTSQTDPIDALVVEALGEDPEEFASRAETSRDVESKTEEPPSDSQGSRQSSATTAKPPLSARSFASSSAAYSDFSLCDRWTPSREFDDPGRLDDKDLKFPNASATATNMILLAQTIATVRQSIAAQQCVLASLERQLQLMAAEATPSAARVGP